MNANKMCRMPELTKHLQILRYYPFIIQQRFLGLGCRNIKSHRNSDNSNCTVFSLLLHKLGLCFLPVVSYYVSNQYYAFRELGKVTSSMQRFSFLTLGNHNRSRSTGAKPACHTIGAAIRDEYSTRGKLTTAGSLLALYNEHSPDLPMGQLTHKELPDYATLRRRLLEIKQPSAPPA